MNRSASVLIFISFFFLSFTGNLNLVDAGDTASVILNSGNFEQLVMQSKDVWFVLFGNPRCPNVKRLRPEWEKASKALEGKVKFGEVDCDVEKDIQSRFGVFRFPSVFAFGPDKSAAPTKLTLFIEGTAAALEKDGLSYYEKAQGCKMDF
ncbi:hypothetical protein Lser_V15G45616 [Lactuca serriola]